jgi:flagellar basal body rod protein FlgC
MSAISSIALSGLNAASQRLHDSATRVANGGTNVDLADEAVQQITARIDFAANAQMLKTDAQMTTRLLDIAV